MCAGTGGGGPIQIEPKRTDFRNYVENLRKARLRNCLRMRRRRVDRYAIDLVQEIHLLIPSMTILGTDGVCSDRLDEAAGRIEG